MHKITTKFRVKDFVLFSLPLSLTYILHNVVIFTDNAMVGRLGPDYMAGLTIGFRFTFLCLMLFLSFVNASGIMGSIYWGQKDKKNYNDNCASSVFLNLSLAVILSGFLFFFGKQAAGFLSTDPVVIGYASQYMKIMAFNLIIVGYNATIAVFLTSSGDTKYPLISYTITTSLNFIFNYLLIYGKLGFPKLHIEGAAYASVFTAMFGSVIMTLIVHKRKKFPSWRSIFQPHFSKIVTIAKIGFPMLIDFFLWQFSILIYMKFISASGTEAMAIYGILNIFLHLCSIFVVGFFSGVGIKVGHLIGAKKFKKAYTYSKDTLIFTIIYSFVIVTVFILVELTGAYSHYFKLPPEMRNLLFVGLILVGVKQLLGSMNGIMSSAIRAGKETKSILYCGLGGFFLFGLPLILIAGLIFKLGFIGILTIMVVSDAVFTISLTIIYFRKKWIFKAHREERILELKKEVNSTQSKVLPA